MQDILDLRFSKERQFYQEKKIFFNTGKRQDVERDKLGLEFGNKDSHLLYFG